MQNTGKTTKPDYTLKATVLEMGLARAQRKQSYLNYKLEYSLKHKDLEQANKTRNELDTFLSQHQELEDIAENYPYLLKEAERINHAYTLRVLRLKERIKNYITNYECLFLTLTFTDKVLESTTEKTRRRYVIRALKEYSNNYVANIDYGGELGREHYHAVVCCNHIDHSKWFNKYGVIKAEHIRLTDNTEIRLAKYISKLTNHAIKTTTKANYIIYSRT